MVSGWSACAVSDTHLHVHRKEVTRMRVLVSVEERLHVAVTVWRLATNVDYTAIAELFGLGRATMCSICWKLAMLLLPISCLIW